VLALQNIDYKLLAERITKQTGIDKLKLLWEHTRLKRFSLQAYEQDWNAVVVCSPADEEVIQTANPRMKTLIMPNGVDLNYYMPGTPLQKNPLKLLFVGSMFYYPNIQAIEYFFEEILPHVRSKQSDAEVIIVGHRPPPSIIDLGEQLPYVTVTGSVPDVRPYFEEATMLIVPLQLGGGTSLKVLEGLAMERPVISTSKGCRGLSLTPDEDLLVADTPEAFAEAILQVSADDDLCRTLVEAGRRSVEKYDWSLLTRSIRELCEELV
jgi:glycosyltransferase involved in cell wall biosynthesis